ncbi:metallophosphoesterase family protein [Viridibacterium curvum]|uniref:Metallophosphoesterase family protein n=1 Tax=Viridibacterium curvum TaxID=1101404 RepID=A0ABP9QM82_9RHOO
MKYAFIADLHSNIEALEAVLHHAAMHGVERRVFLGDLVGYGADPAAVVDRVAACLQDGDLAVMGNHDSAVCARERDAMNDEAQAAVLWTRGQLSAEQLSFLRDLPLILRQDDITCVHASAAEPGRWTYVFDGLAAMRSLEEAGTPWVFSGHVHDPTLFYAGRDGRLLPFLPSEGVAIPVPAHRQWLSIVGSCGQPRDLRPGARYALFDSDQQRLRFFRVPYDATVPAAKIRAAGLAERFALHLEGRA